MTLTVAAAVDQLMGGVAANAGDIRIDETPMRVLKSERAATSEHLTWARVARASGGRLIDCDATPAVTGAERLLLRAERWGGRAVESGARGLCVTHANRSRRCRSPSARAGSLIGRTPTSLAVMIEGKPFEHLCHLRQVEATQLGGQLL
jgi:hypothetical protein